MISKRPRLKKFFVGCPTPNLSFSAKPVSKNWYSVISSPYFAHRYISHHFNRRYNQTPCAIIIEYWRQFIEYRLFTFFVDPLFKSPGFELNYLRDEWGSCKVVAVYKDLMLCSINRMDGILRFCICNPFTMQWWFISMRGLSFFFLWAYCSETQKWNRSVINGKEYQSSRYCVAYTGKLLGYNGRSIFAYDPFNPERSIFIDFSYIHSTKLSVPMVIIVLGFVKGLYG